MVNLYEGHRTDDQVEVCCEGCRGKMTDVALANRGICPACGGHTVGIRFCRNPLTGKILYADRVEL
jgi:Zn finger protein HypA/HybF involved in hydrogenase expression